jgi:hypothetical protein
VLAMQRAVKLPVLTSWLNAGSQPTGIGWKSFKLLLAAHRSIPQGRIILQYKPAMRSKIQMLSLRGSP